MPHAANFNSIIRPHCSTTCRCGLWLPTETVLSVTLVRPAKMAQPIDMTFGMRTRVGPGNYVLDGVHIIMATGNFEGEGVVHCKVQGHSVVICAKMAEPMVLPFGLLARTGPMIGGPYAPMGRDNFGRKGRPL